MNVTGRTRPYLVLLMALARKHLGPIFNSRRFFLRCTHFCPCSSSYNGTPARKNAEESAPHPGSGGGDPVRAASGTVPDASLHYPGSSLFEDKCGEVPSYFGDI